MKGENYMVLNQETVKEAIQEYLEYRWKGYVENCPRVVDFGEDLDEGEGYLITLDAHETEQGVVMDEHGNQQYTPNECAEILTHGGGYFRFDDPDDTEGMDIESIAHALALTNRFGGHTRVPYSVAQHSVHVSYLCDPEDALWGLLHDAPEAYITDIVRPAKALLPDYQALEASVMRKLARYYRLPGDEVPESVRQADLIMCATEKRDLIPHAAEHDWHLPYPPRDLPVRPLDWPLARYAFLKRYYELAPGVPLQ